MALSNTFKEPQRELTESAVGIGALLLFVFADIWIMRGVAHLTHIPDDATSARAAIALFQIPVLVVAAFVLYGIAYVLHGLGDTLCDILDDIGIRLRPKWRLERGVRILSCEDGHMFYEVRDPKDFVVFQRPISAQQLKHHNHYGF